jgi:hypothetical protein
VAVVCLSRATVSGHQQQQPPRTTSCAAAVDATQYHPYLVELLTVQIRCQSASHSVSAGCVCDHTLGGCFGSVNKANSPSCWGLLGEVQDVGHRLERPFRQLEYSTCATIVQLLP